MIIKINIKLLLLIIVFILSEYKIFIWHYYIYFKNIKKKIKIAIFSSSIKNGGIERQTTLMLNYFNKVNFFDLYLFTKKDKEKNEYNLDKNIKRKVIKNNLIQILVQNDIDILIYQFYKHLEINQLNNMNKIKIIVINRSCFLHWMYYRRYYFFKTVYKAYRHCKYLISLIPFENNYLFLILITIS